ncbi:MAG: hypothetical protein IE914_08370 [Thiotrichales bacterium]|nr:hypothetical protein [Thiotrichales bacterium]
MTEIERISRKQGAALLNRSLPTLKRYIQFLTIHCPYSFGFNRYQEGINEVQLRMLKALAELYDRGWQSKEIAKHLEENPLIEE